MLKASALYMYKTPVGAGSSELVPADLAMMFELMVGFLVSGWLLAGLPGFSHSTESLILAQDERWRRA